MAEKPRREKRRKEERGGHLLTTLNGIIETGNCTRSENKSFDIICDAEVKENEAYFFTLHLILLRSIPKRSYCRYASIVMQFHSIKCVSSCIEYLST